MVEKEKKMRVSNEDKDYLKKCFPDQKEYIREYNKLWKKLNLEKIKIYGNRYSKTKKNIEYRKNYYMNRKMQQPEEFKEKAKRHWEKRKGELQMLREFYNKYKDWVYLLEKQTE